MAKTTYGNMQTLDKRKFFRSVLIGVLVLVVIIVVLSLIRKANQKPETVEAPEIAQTSMVPSTIRYYDPSQEKTFDTGADYIILTDGDQRVKVDSSGNASYVSETGQTIATLSGEAKNSWISQAVTIMQTDQQAAMALAGLESLLPEEEPAAVATGPLTQDETLRMLLEEMGIPYEDFVGQVYGIGSTLNDVYTMLWMYEDDEGIIRSIMAAETKTEEDSTPKSVSVTVEKLGGNTAEVSVTDTSSAYEYPSWMQETDTTAAMSAMVDSLAALSNASSSGSVSSTWENTNQQASKSSWLDQQQSLEAGYSGKLTKWDLAWGTVIPITLVTGLNTDLPGNVIGLVRSDIYDTLTGTNILIPKGSRVIASYNSNVSFGQTSVQIAWTQLITPEGLVYNLPGFQGIDPQGFSGVSGKVNNHFWAILGGAVLGSVINYSADVLDNAATSAAEQMGNQYITGYAEAVAGSTLDTTAGYLSKYTSMWTSLQPTITIKTGAQIQMLVNQTINFKR